MSLIPSISIKTFEINTKDDVYDILELVGRGGWGQVYKGRNKQDNNIISLKFFGYTSNKPDINIINNEIMLMISLIGVEGVVQMKSFFYDTAKGLLSNNKKVYLSPYPVIVMEMLAGGGIPRKIDKRVKANGKISEVEISRMFRGVIEALDSLHRRNFIHRDLKLENLIYVSEADDSPLKIIDFGCMIQIAEEESMIQTNSKIGTAGYFAPESFYGIYSYKTDIWQAGCILYAILCGYTPFHGDKSQEIYNKKGIFYREKEWDNLSANAQDLISSMLCVNPEERFSIQQILNHIWMKDGASTKSLGKAYARKIGGLTIRNQLRDVFSQENIDKLAAIFHEEGNENEEYLEHNLSQLPQIQNQMNETSRQLSHTSMNMLSSIPVPSFKKTRTHPLSYQSSNYSIHSTSSNSSVYSENPNIRKWFNKFDKNKNDSISEQEFKEGIYRILVKDRSFLEDDNISSLDDESTDNQKLNTSTSTKININDNTSSSLHSTPTCPHTTVQVQELFLAVDRNKTGEISYEDFSHFFEMIIHHTEIKKLFETQFIQNQEFNDNSQNYSNYLDQVHSHKRKFSTNSQDLIQEENEIEDEDESNER